MYGLQHGSSKLVMLEGIKLRLFEGSSQGCFLWQCSLELARWIAKNSSMFEGKDVIELGSGVGLAGFVAARQNAKSVVLSDYIPQVLENLTFNAALNLVACPRISVQHLEWSGIDTAEGEMRNKKFDIVIGGDILYSGYSVVPDLFSESTKVSIEHGNFTQVAYVLSRVLRADGEVHLFCRVRENDDEFDDFYNEIKLFGFKTTVRTVDVELCEETVDHSEIPFILKHIHAVKQWHAH
eukprot:CFRG1775T1